MAVGSEHSASSRSAPAAQRASLLDGPVSPVYTRRPSGAVSDSATLSAVWGTGKVSRFTSRSSGNGSPSCMSRMPIGNPGSKSHGPYPSASCFTSRTTPRGPKITSGSLRAGTVVCLRAYTSIGSSPQWSGWKCDKITCVTACQGKPNWASRWSAPAPQSSRIFRFPRATQWHAEVRVADGATVPVPTVTSSILGRLHLSEPHANDGRYPGLLHRDAVDGVRGLHSPGVMRDDDELRQVFELGEQMHVAAHIGIVQRRIHFVQQTERARLREEDGKQERDRHEGPLAGGEQMDPLGPLAARRGVDLDLALERLVLVREPYVTLTSPEQRLKDGAEVLAHLAERLEEQGLRRLVDLAGGLLQRVARGHEIVPLGHEELEPLRLVGVLVDRERVHRPHRVDRRAEPLVLLAQPLELSGHGGGVGEQLLERPTPLGLNLRHEAAPPPQGLRALELELVLGRAAGFEPRAHLLERRLRFGETRVRGLDLGRGVLGGGLERAERETTLLERVRPLCLLRREGRRIAVERRHLLGERAALAARLVGLRGGARDVLPRRNEPGLQLRGVHLPADALLAAHPRQLVVLELRVQRRQSCLDLRQALRQPVHLGGRVGGLPLRMRRGALGVAPRRTRLELLRARPLRGLAGGGEGGLRSGELGERALQCRRRGAARRFRVAHLLPECFELRAPLQRSARRPPGQEHGAVGAAQRAPAVEHRVAGEQRTHPRRRRAVHPERILERMPVGRSRRPGHARQEHQGSRLRLLVPAPDRGHVRLVPHQYGVQPLAKQLLRQFGIGPAGPYEVRERSDHGIAELRAHLQERLRPGGEPDPLALELGQCVAPRRYLRHRLLRLPARGPRVRLLLLELGHAAPRVLERLGGLCRAARLGRGALGLGLERGRRHLLARLPGVALVGRLARLLAQLGALPLERGALAFERPEPLGQALLRLLELPDRGALGEHPVADLLLAGGPGGELLPDRRQVALRRGALRRGRRTLALRLEGAPFFRVAALARRGAPLAGVAQPLGGEG